MSKTKTNQKEVSKTEIEIPVSPAPEDVESPDVIQMEESPVNENTQKLEDYTPITMPERKSGNGIIGYLISPEVANEKLNLEYPLNLGTEFVTVGLDVSGELTIEQIVSLAAQVQVTIGRDLGITEEPKLHLL